MAFKKSFNDIFGTVLVLSALLSTASAVDCHGKSFHCVNSTHFMICVDLGGGVSQSIDNFLIPCPAPTVCQGTNHFECEFPAPTTPVTTLNVISEITQPWEDIIVTTNSPQRNTTKEYSENYVNTESLTLADSFTTDATADHTTEMPLSSTTTDLNKINITEAVSTLPESNYYETTTTVDTVTEPILINGTTTYSEQAVNTENITTGTAEVITEIPQTIPENISTGAIEVTTEIPLIDTTTVEAFISNASDIPQTTPENTTTGTAEVITEIPQTIPENIPTGAIEVTTEIPLIDTTTVEAFISNASDILETTPENITTGTAEVITEIPQTIPENIPIGAIEVTTEIPLVDTTTEEAFIGNLSDIPQTTPDKTTTGTAEGITEIPQTIPENIPTGAIEVTTDKPLVETTTVETFVSNISDIPQTTSGTTEVITEIPQTIPTGVIEVTTEIPLVDTTTGEAFIGNVSDIPQTIPEITTTGTAELITEIPQTIPENIPTGAIEVTTDKPLVETTTVEAFVSSASDIPQTTPENTTTGTAEVITEIPQTIPENIPTGVIEVTTEKPLVDIITGEAFISNASDILETTPENITTGTAEVITEIPQTIPENIPTGAIEVTTYKPLVGTTTVEAFVSNASDISQTTPENTTTGTAEVITEIPQTIPENIPTGVIEVTTEIPIVDTTTESFIGNSSDILQTTPDNITTGTAEGITEMLQTIPENIPTGTIEVTTEKPLVEITTEEAFVSNASDITQTKSENTTTGTEEVVTEIPQTIPENIPTGVIEVTTEKPLVDIITGEAFTSNASDILKTTPENITTGTAEVITEIPQTIPEDIPTGAIEVTTDKPLVETTTVEVFVSNASDIPQTTPENTTTGTAEVITEIPQTIPENISTGAIEVITEIPLVDVTTEAFIGNASDILQTIPENITTAAGEAITDIPLVDMSTADLNNVFLETMPSTISDDSSSKIQVNLTAVPENTTNINITSNSTVNANDYAETTLNTDKIVDNQPVTERKTEESYTTEVNSLANSQFGSTGDVVRNGATLEQTTSDNLNFDVGNANTYQTSTTGPKEILTTDTTVNSITELPALNEQNSINRLPTTINTETVATENPTFSINPNDQTQTDDINITERPFIVTKNDQIQSISSDDKLNFTTENIPSMNKTGIVIDANNNNETVENIISSSQDKTRTETNEVIRNQKERKSTSDLPTGENKTDTNILANIIFDIVIQKPKTSTEKPMPTLTDENLNKVANEIKTEIPLLSAFNDQIQKVTGDEALGTEKNTLITENNFITDNTYLTIEKSTQNTITQFPQEQEVSTIETGYLATEKSNTNTFGNTMTTENSVYLPTDTSILTTSEGFHDKIQSPNSTEQPVDILIPEIVKANSTNWGDTITTNNPLEGTVNTLSSIFDINAIKHDLNKIPTKEKVFEGSGITDIPIVINLDSSTTGRDLMQNNSPLDNINGGLGSNNLNEREAIESTIHLKETTLTNEKETEIKSDISSGTTTEYNKIATIDNIEIQENTRASLGTTDNKNVIDITSSVTIGTPHEINVKKINTTIDRTNAIDEISQGTKIGSSIPNMPVLDSKNISQTNINSDVSIDQFGKNTKSDAVDYATVALVNFSSTVNSVTDKTNLSGGNLGVVVTKNDVINQQGTSNVLPQTNTMVNNLNQDSQQPNVAGILVTDDLNSDKTTKESNNGPINIQIYPQSNDVATSKDYIISAPTNEKLPSTGLENIATQTTKTVNRLIDNQDLASSTMLVTETNNETKSIFIENIQNALQAIGNFINIASKNSTRAVGNTENQAQAEMNNKVSKGITEANIATESESVFNNLQVSKSNNILSKPDANIKWRSTESIPANNGQNIEYKNINRPGSHIVPFDETNENTKKSDDQVLANEVSKIIIKEISPKTSESMSKNQLGTVMESATLDTLTTKITKILSSDTANDNEGNLLSTYNSKVENIEIRTESYKPVTSNPATIIIRTPSYTNNILHKSDNLLRVVPEAQNVPYVNPTNPALSSTSEKTITNGDKADIGTVHSNAKVDEKPNVENAIALENIAQNIRSISTLIPGNSVTEVDNALQSTDITITDSAFDGNTQKDLSSTIATPELIYGSAQDRKPSTGEVNNSGTRYPANMDVEKIYEKILSSNINQQGDLRDGNAHISIVGKEINQRLIPNHETISSGISTNKSISPTKNITSTSTVQPRTNSAAVLKSTLRPDSNNIISVISQNSTNVEQNTSDNTPSLIKGQVIPTEKPVNKPHSSVTSTTQASMKNTPSKSVSTETENPKKQVVNNNTLHYSCINGVRGKYSDKDDCRKFYICFGNTEPIVGHCPVNTVFSDIKKLCTKNMSHCIRENEFKCPSDGRFSDVLQENVYYICVNHQNHLYRFKFQCQTGYTLNKTTVRCIENKEIESNESVSISSDDVSDSSGSTSITSTGSIGTGSTSSSSSSGSSSSSSSNTGGDSESKSSKRKKNTEKSEDQDDDEDDDEVFECKKEGKFPVRGDCRRYYLCKKKGKGRYRRKLKKCGSGDIFHKSKKRCVDADDYEC